MKDAQDWGQRVLNEARARLDGNPELSSVEIRVGKEGTLDIWCVLAPVKEAV